MSHTVYRPRVSTSPRGYYNMDQPLVQKRGRSIQIVTDITQSPTSSTSSLSLSRPHTAIPYVPEPPSPNYHTRNHGRSGSFTRERRLVEANIVTRSPDHYPESPSHYSPDTQGELAHFYKRQLIANREPQRQLVEVRPKPSSHRTKPTHAHPERYELALVPVQHRDQAIIVERMPRVKPVVVEKKETIMIRDDQGRWCKVRRVVR